MLKNNKTAFLGASIVWGLTVAIVPIAPSVQAATLTYTGTTIGGSIWNRPVANFSDPSTAIAGGAGETVSYSTFGFTVTTPDNYVFQSTVTSPNFDNYTFLYKNSFDPTAPFSNIIIGNDDNPTIGLSGFTTALNTSTNYFLVTTGFNNFDAGTFSNTIAGVGNIVPSVATSVPEPATILGSIAAFSYGAYSRRKMKRTRSIDKKNF